MPNGKYIRIGFHLFSFLTTIQLFSGLVSPLQQGGEPYSLRIRRQKHDHLLDTCLKSAFPPINASPFTIFCTFVRWFVQYCRIISMTEADTTELFIKVPCIEICPAFYLITTVKFGKFFTNFGIFKKPASFCC